MTDMETLEKRLERERQARRQAERIAEEKTHELFEANKQLQHKNEELEQEVAKRSKEFADAVEVFSRLIQLRSDWVANHSQRVAQMVHPVCQRLGLDEETTQATYHAALLHDIGQLALPDRLFGRPFAMLTAGDRELFMEHPALGETVLMNLEILDEAAIYIRSHHEYLNGTGGPDQLRGEEIPTGTRVLTAADDLDRLRHGTLLVKRLSMGNALAYLYEYAGTHYDLEVVRILWQIFGYGDPEQTTEEQPSQGYGPPPRPPHTRAAQAQEEAAERLEAEGPGASAGEGAESDLAVPETESRSKQTLGIPQLREGMTLAADLNTPGGLLLLSSGHTLDRRTINKLHSFEKHYGIDLAVVVDASEEGYQGDESPFPGPDRSGS